MSAKCATTTTTMTTTPTLLLVLVLFATAATHVEGRTKSPLMDESDTKMVNKAAECVFGTQIKDLGSSWIPDLGPPIGVLYCTRCECVKTQRKRRIVARVQCRSIKNECPESTCAEPVLLPGNCCKSCPGESYSEAVQDIIPKNIAEEEDKISNHYAALLTGRSSLLLRNDDNKPIQNENKNNVVATGRFIFQRRSLYYSFYISDRAARPYRLQFVDHDANILEEIFLSESGGAVNSVYQNATRKVCGVWKRIPRDYRRLLKEERLYVVLVWGTKTANEFMLSGQIKRYTALDTELFSSLMEPAPGTSNMHGAGGTGVIYTSTTLTPSIHVAIVFNGIFESNETADVPVEITLSMDERKTPILRETRLVTKPALELNLVELSTAVSTADLRLLTRGRLLLSIASVSRPHSLKLVGSIMTKTTCELFQAALAPPTPTNQPETNGLAWMYLNNEGSLVYNVQIDGFAAGEAPELIVLSDMSSKRKIELLDITPSYSNGWANGTLDKVSPKILEPLYSGNLSVNVARTSNATLARGKLTAKLVADARDAPAPVLLKREGNALTSSAVGMAWINIDNICNLHYDVALTGYGHHTTAFDVYLEMLPMIAPGAPVITRHLSEVTNGNADGSTNDVLRREEIQLLDSGVAFLKVRDKNNKTMFAATLKQVKVPQSCLPPLTEDNNVGLPLDANDDNGGLHVLNGGACLHGGRFYNEEESWTSTADACVKCFCQNGNARCDTAKCPPLQCAHGGRQRVHAGDCCPVCVDDSRPAHVDDGGVANRCSFGGQTYSSGAKFHPFLIPNGFDTCIECACDNTQVKCAKLTHAGCQPQAVVESLNGTFVGDHPHAHHPRHYAQQHQQQVPPTVPSRTADQILRDGGCENPMNRQQPYENHQVYHPVLASLGEYKCVTCKCENGETKCHRPRCTREMCEKARKARKAKTPLNPNEPYCCMKDCKRYKRHPNKSNRARVTS